MGNETPDAQVKILLVEDNPGDANATAALIFSNALRLWFGKKTNREE